MSKDNTKKLISYYEKGFSQPEPTSNITLIDVYKLIKGDTLKDSIEEIRSKPTKDERDKLKKKLPCIKPTGTFKGSKALVDMVQHSGYFCADFDHINTSLKNNITSDTFLNPALTFVSPSGDGVKSIINIDGLTKENHEDCAKALETYFYESFELELDKACYSPAMGCNLSYDSDSVYNESGSVLFSDIIKISEPRNLFGEIEIDNTDILGFNEFKLIALSEKALGKHGFEKGKGENKGNWFKDGEIIGLSNEYKCFGNKIFHLYSDDDNILPEGNYTPFQLICWLNYDSNVQDCIKALKTQEKISHSRVASNGGDDIKQLKLLPQVFEYAKRTLLNLGWQKGKKESEWTRPGKLLSAGNSATFNIDKDNIPKLQVYTSSDSIFARDHYSVFDVILLGEFNDNKAACRKALASMFLDPLKPQPKVTTHTSIKPNMAINPEMILSKKDGIIYEGIQELNIIYNELNSRLYLGDRYLKNSDINDIAIKCRVIDKSITEANVFNLVRSSLVPKFNPMIEYIKKLESMPLKRGVINELFECIKVDGHSPDYLDRIVKKWFGGFMGTLLGDYSIMTLVLVGGQGVGKSLFVRNILPNGLKEYFTEAAVKEDKDFFALMCSNLIVYDDEFTSKNKTEATIYKKIASAPNYTYREPHAKINETKIRTGVLCGSANDADVISDRTGNRRIIPLNVLNIDHVKMANIDLDEFYRELLELSKNDYAWWYLTLEEIEFLNSDSVGNVAINEEEELLQRFTNEDENGHISTTEVINWLSIKQHSYRVNTHKMGRALTTMYGKSILKSVNGNKIRGYKLSLAG